MTDDLAPADRALLTWVRQEIDRRGVRYGTVAIGRVRVSIVSGEPREYVVQNGEDEIRLR